MYQIFVYVPEDSVESLKEALFELGVGKLGDYSHCVWQTSGEGQFKPLEYANPHIGDIGKLNKTKEVKLEFFCDRLVNIDRAISVLKSAHPYETPAYGVIKLEQ